MTVKVDLLTLERPAVGYVRGATYTDAAVTANEAILDVAPDDVDALLRLLRCRLERGEYDSRSEVVRAWLPFLLKRKI